MFSDTDDYYSLSFDNSPNEMILVENTKSGSNALASATLNYHLFKTNVWTKFTIEFSESIFVVLRHGKSVISYKSDKPLVMYWYTLVVERGWITWAANCDPLEPGADPVDGEWGEWSKWECDAKCNGGKGVRFWHRHKKKLYYLIRVV